MYFYAAAIAPSLSCFDGGQTSLSVTCFHGDSEVEAGGTLPDGQVTFYYLPIIFIQLTDTADVKLYFFFINFVVVNFVLFVILV